MRIFLTLFNVMNGQLCWRGNLSRPFIPTVVPVFLNTGTLPRQLPSICLGKMTGRYILQLRMFLCGGLIDIDWFDWFAFLTTTDLPLSEKSVSLKVVQIYSWIFFQR